MRQMFGTRRLTRIALVLGLIVAASATAFAQLTVQGSVPIHNDPNSPPGPPGNDPRQVAISTLGGLPKAWVANYGTGGVAVFDLSVVPATEIAFIPAPAGFGHAYAVDVKDSACAVTYSDPTNGSYVEVYDVTSPGAILASFQVALAGTGSRLEGIGIVDNLSLVVSDAGRNSVSAWFYDGANAGQTTGPEVLTTASTHGPGYRPTDVRIVTLGANKIALVIEADSNRFEIFPIRNRAVRLPSRAIPTGLDPQRIFVEPTTPLVFVTNNSSDSVLVLGRGGLNALLTTAIDGPVGIAGSTDVTGNLHLYVANRNTRSVAYFKGPIGAIPTFQTAITVSRAPYGLASQFGLPVGVPPNPPTIGDRIIDTSLADDAIDDLGRQ